VAFEGDGVTATTPTICRFGPCELDEARRSLTAEGREIKLQPRVFDLLCYLVRHRDRVVGKDELLDALWPGSVVVDNALQRVVSLARAALAEAGLADAVRTYPRHGYRFCLDDCEDAPAAAVSHATAAHAALDRHDWPAACDAYARADARAPLLPHDIELWGRAAICAGRGAGVVAALERAVAQRDHAGDTLGAARLVLLLVQIRIDQQQAPLARGLLQRAEHYLDGRRDVAERGQFAWMAARMALGSGDAALALQRADEAWQLGRALRRRDIECLGLVYRGHALMSQGDMAAGLAQHEEAAAIIRLGGMPPWVAGWALCAILYAARHRCDWLRAGHFAEAYVSWSHDCQMPAFPGTCQLHRAAVLGMRGELVQAAAEARAAAALVAEAAPWAEGDACCVLGDILLNHGDLTGAEAAFRQAQALGWNPQPGLARLHLMTGQPQRAQRGLQQALEDADWTLLERRGLLLCILAQASIANGDPATARQTLQALQADAGLLASEALRGLHAQAQAELAHHDGQLSQAIHHLRQAVRHWREAGSPVGEAEARTRLAECLQQDDDPTACALELHVLEHSLSGLTGPHHARLQAVRTALA
jgi:DNA-binding winged helix-turn-helix (wHTH) protein